MKRALLVHNDGAGDGKIDAAALSQVLEAAGIAVRRCAPKDSNLDACLAQEADLVIVAGGDGTVARLLAQMPDFPDRRIAIVPLGTANNIAQSLHILSSVDPGAGEEILNGWRHSSHQTLDIGLVTGPWGEQRFVEAVGIGPLARTIIQFKTKDVDPIASMRLGREAFAHAVQKCDALRSRVAIDGREITEDLLLVEIMNIQHAGSRVHLAPKADPGDGVFDVVTLMPAQREDFITWLEKGSGNDVPPVDIRRGRRIELTWQRDPLRIDDYAPEAGSQEGDVSVAFASQRLSVLVPSAIDKEAKASSLMAAS